MKNNYIKNRIANLRTKLNEKNIEAALVTKRENYIYLSGFTGSEGRIIITPHDAILLVDFRYTEQARSQSPDYTVVEYSGDLIDTINEIIINKKISSLGFEENDFSYKQYNQYSEKINTVKFIPLEETIEGLRIIKDSFEIEVIKKAVKVADDAFSYILNVIKPGMKEAEVAVELEYYMKKLGASGTSFESIVASGKRSALPHGVASDKVIETGDTVTLDFGASYNNYCSDMTRTIFVGQPDEEMKKIYNIVLEAQQKSEQNAFSGMNFKDIDKAARDIITAYGYSKNFGHGLGHGVGLEVHEEPRVSPKGILKAKNGMVITVEPGIYVNGFGGVRIEDMVIINNKNPEILTQSTKEMIII